MLAAKAGLVQRVKELLAEGAQVNSRDRNGDSPLNMAAADHSLRDDRGKTAADIARELDHGALARLLAQ